MNTKITILLIIALLSVSTSPIIGRALENINAVSISFWRMFIAAIILWSFSIFKPQGHMMKKSISIEQYVLVFYLGFTLHYFLKL